MNQDMTINIRNVSKRFGNRVLFSSINCQAGSGDCLVITGKNGSGKTTLIKIIARLLRPSSGHVDISAGGGVLKDAEQSLPYIGMVSPEIVLYDQLTGEENIRLLARARGVAPDAGRIARAMAGVGLSAENGQYVKTYSTGMKQRLKYALLTAIDPPIWLIDEGLSNLDGDGRSLILSLIENALKQRRLIALATNEQAEVAYASQTIVLS